MFGVNELDLGYFTTVLALGAPMHSAYLTPDVHLDHDVHTFMRQYFYHRSISMKSGPITVGIVPICFANDVRR